MKKIFAWMLAGVMLLSTVSVWGATPNLTDITDAQAADDVATVEKLLRQEKTVNRNNDRTVTLSIDESATRPLNRRVMGVQCELPDTHENLQNIGTTELAEGYLKIANEIHDAPVARWGGGHSDDLNLMYNIGPLEERKHSYDLRVAGDGNLPIGEEWGYHRAAPSTIGPVEFIKALQAVNPEVEFLITLPIFTQTPEESNQFVHFLLDEKDESEWGALRASYGIEEPVKLLGFELGNENYFQANAESYHPDHATMTDAEKKAFAVSQAEVYTRYCTNHINAIEKDFPGLDFFCNVSGNHSSRIYADPWTQTIARDMHDKIAGVAFHYYYGSVAACNNEMNHIQSVYKGVTGEKTKFVITEHAQWGSGNTVTRKSLSAALPEAGFFNAMFMRDDVICCNYHNMEGTHWALFQRLEGKYYTTGINEVHRLYNMKLGDTILTTKNANGSDFTLDFSAITTKRDNGQVVIALLNKTDGYYNVSFQFKNKTYNMVHETVFTAPNKYSGVHNENTKDIFTVQDRKTAVSGVSGYVVPNESLVFLTLEETNNPVGAEEPTLVRFAGPEPVEKDLDASDAFSKGEPDNVLYVEKHGEKLAPVVSSRFEALSVDTASLLGDGKTYTGAASKQRIGSTDFYLLPPYLGSPVNKPIQVTNPQEGGMILSAGIDQAAINLIERKCVLAWQPEEFYELTNNYKLTVNAHVDNSHPGFGVRFHVSQDGKSYYLLQIHAPNDDKGKPVWALYKFVDGVNHGVQLQSKVIPAVSTDAYLRHDYQIELTVRDNASVEVHVTGREGEFDETQTFFDTSSRALIYNAKSAGYIGFVKNGAGEVHLKKVTLENLTEKDTSDRYYFSGGTILRKVVNNSHEPATVLVCNDDFSYKTLAQIQPGEKFVNTLTDQNYEYVKIEGGKDVQFFTSLGDLGALRPVTDVTAVSARIGGADADQITMTSSDIQVLTCADNVLIPVQTGTANISVTNGEKSMEIPVQVSGFAGIFEDFEAYGDVPEMVTPLTYTGAEVPVVGPWVVDPNNARVVTNKPRMYVQDGKFYMCGTGVNIFSSWLANMKYGGNLKGTDGDYTISLDCNKVSVYTGVAFRFHMYGNGDDSYYQLLLAGGADSGYLWRFDKILNGVRIAEASVYGPSMSAPTDANGGALSGDVKVSMRVNNGNISWTIDGKRYGNIAYSGQGSFVDENFFPADGEELSFGFLVNCSNPGLSKYCSFDNIRVTGRTVEQMETMETPYGKYLLFNKDALGEDCAVLEAQYADGMLKDLVLHNAETWKDQDFGAIFVPNKKLDNTRYFFWDMKTLKPIYSIE